MARKDDVKVGIGGETKGLKSSLAESRALISQFARAGSSALQPFSRALSGVFGNIFSLRGALTTLAGTGGLGLLVTSSVAAADAIGKTASRIGVGVEAYQELSFAARESGVAQDLFNTSLTALVRRSGEAISGNKGFAKSFADLGITIEDLRALRPEDLLGRVADGVRKLGSQAEQIAALDKVMSEAGRRMFNFTNLGSDGIARLRQEARDLGVVLDSVMVREAEKAGDQLGRVGNILRTNLTRAVLSLTPQIVALAEGFTRHLQPALQWLIQHLPDTAVASDELRRRLGALGGEIETVAGMSLQTLLKLPDFSRFDAETRGVLAGLLGDYKRLGDLMLERERKEALVAAALNVSAAANEGQANKIKEVAEALQFELDQLGRNETTQRLYAEAKKAGVEVNAEFTASIEPLLRQMEAVKKADEAAAESAKAWQKVQDDWARQGQAVYDRTRTPLEKYQASLQELNDLLARGAIDQDTYSRALHQAQDAFDQAAQKTDLLTVAQGQLGDIIRDTGNAALNGNIKSWQDWGRVAVNAIARVWAAWVDLQLAQQQSGSSGGGLLGSLAGGLGSIFSLFGGGAGIDYGGSSFGLGGGATPFAAGGDPPVGRVALVGEEGPELWVPRSAGTVIPAGRTAALLAGGGGSAMTVNLTMNNPTRDMIPDLLAGLRGLGAEVNRIDSGLESRAVTAVTNARGRDPELFGGAA